jgi:hypothetical protein
MVKPTPPTAPEAPLRSDAAFSAKAQTFLTWLSGLFYSYVGDAVDFVDERADEALAAATTFGFPSISGKALHLTRVNAAGTALEFRTPAQVKSDIGAPPTPATSAGLGQWTRAFSPSSGAACTLPAGGTWAYFLIVTNASTGSVSLYASSVAAGGTNVYQNVGDVGNALCWRIA